MTRGAELPGYSTREVAHMLGLSEARIRGFVRSGFLRPGRGTGGAYRFSFQDLVILRAAEGLVAARIPRRRVLKALIQLREQLPKGRSLAAVRIVAEGSRVVVREGEAAWEPESGQQVLRFEVAELAARAAVLAPAKLERAQSKADLNADDWFDLGYELEPTALSEAIAAYHRALELSPSHAEAQLNLGRLLHEQGKVAEAEAHYRAALEQRPHDATAAFNLGVALQDQDRQHEAIAAYRRAIAEDPDFGDAYFNLADVYEKLGDKAAAIRNLRMYRRLVRT